MYIQNARKLFFKVTKFSHFRNMKVCYSSVNTVRLFMLKTFLLFGEHFAKY
jgi:hypothetical protein